MRVHSRQTVAGSIERARGAQERVPDDDRGQARDAPRRVARRAVAGEPAAHQSSTSSSLLSSARRSSFERNPATSNASSTREVVRHRIAARAQHAQRVVAHLAVADARRARGPRRRAACTPRRSRRVRAARARYCSASVLRTVVGRGGSRVGTARSGVGVDAWASCAPRRVARSTTERARTSLGSVWLEHRAERRVLGHRHARHARQRHRARACTC